jgi:acyl-CoA synthetase (AMP-forming)/AMP-acid ligase II
VVGLDDVEWGQRVALAAVPAAGASLDGDGLRTWGKALLAAAKVPSRFVFVEDLPRNTLGKVVKPEVAKLFT